VSFLFSTFEDQVLRVQPASDGQRALTTVAFDRVQPIDLPPALLAKAREIFGPVDYIPEPAWGVLDVIGGRGWGKSQRLIGHYGLFRMLTADLAGLAPGEWGFFAVVAPDVETGAQSFRFALGAAKAAPSIAHLIESESSDRFVIARPDGRRVAFEVFAASKGGSSVRGRSLVGAGLDEASFFRDRATGTINDADIFSAITPRVLPGGMVVVATTPWLENVGLAATEFTKNFATPTTCIAAHCPTLTMLDTAQNRAMAAREYKRDEDNARRELDAEFLTGGAGLFFGPELVAPAIAPDLPISESWDGKTPDVVSGDIGLVQDASAFAATRRVGDQVILVDLLELRPRKGSPLKLSDVVRLGCEFAERHGAKTIRVDHHVLEPAREHLPDGFHLDPVEGGQAPKAERFLKVRELLRQGQLRIPGQFAQLATQLGDVVSKPTPGGSLSITLPRRGGTHLDTVSAFVIAAWAVAASDGTDWNKVAEINNRLSNRGRSRWFGMGGRGF
jgi:hypothetical protein